MRPDLVFLRFLVSTVVFLCVSCLLTDPMDLTNLNLDGLTLFKECITLNLATKPETAVVVEHCLIGRILADREIQFAYFSKRMSRAWKPGKWVTITKYMAGHYLFQFHHKVDDARVLDEDLWLYDNFHVVMDHISPGVVASFVPLNHIDFLGSGSWVTFNQK